MGTGVIRGFSWGTMVVKASVEYSMEENKFEIGEMAIEYLKRLSPHWRIYVGLEGAEDEIKFNNAFGVTSKATDWAPEIGIMFRF